MTENKEDNFGIPESSEFREDNITQKMRENPWILATFVLGVLTLVLFVASLGGITGSVITGNVISEDTAGNNLLSFFESAGASGLVIESVDEVSGVYVVNLTYQGQNFPYYVTKDGKLAGSLAPLSITNDDGSSSAGDTEIPQTASPEVGLYIWSYCPYGVTALSPFAQVASLLGDSANFKVYLYYAGHGDYEEQQNKIQACIQEVAPEKYWGYAEGFASDIYEKCYGDVNCDLTESTNLMDSLSIDSSAVLACVDEQGDALLDEHYNAAGAVGVTGSPSLVVNGVKANVARNAASYKDAVCSAFTDVPKACSTEMDSTTATTSGSC